MLAKAIAHIKEYTPQTIPLLSLKISSPASARRSGAGGGTLRDPTALRGGRALVLTKSDRSHVVLWAKEL